VGSHLELQSELVTEENTGSGKAEVSTACTEITEYKNILSSHKKRKGVTLFSHTINVFNLKITSFEITNSFFYFCQKLMTYILNFQEFH
jgi:hypothetical protein